MRKLLGALSIGFSALVLVGCASSGSGSNAGNASTDAARRKTIKVTQTERGTLISADEQIFFDTGKSEVTSDGKVILERMAVMLKTKTKKDVVIEGHTDNVGAASINIQLSERRAVAVKAGLVQAGVDAKRMTTKGLGFAQPIADNNTPDGRQANRRTDVIVLGESADKVGGTTWGDRLQDGLDNVMKNVGDFANNVKNAFSK